MNRLLAVGLAALVTTLSGGPAQAAWSLGGSGDGTAGASAVGRPAAPSATVLTGRVDLTWPAVTLAQGTPVLGYHVVRHAGGVTTTVCTVTAPVRACADPSPATGTASYGVVATFHRWRSVESPLASVSYDGTAPVTAVTAVSPTPNASGWSTGPVTVALSATDAGSGVRSVTTQANGGAPVVTPGTSTSVTLGVQGTNTLGYAGTDNAGNAEATKTYSVKVDSVAPTTAVTSSPSPNAAGWNTTSPVTLTLSPSDATSGVASLRWRVGSGGTWTTASTWPVQVPPYAVAAGATGTSTVYFQATDAAGNLEPVSSHTIRIDRSAPSAPSALGLSSDSGASATDAVTNVAAQSLKGTAEAGASVEVRVDGTVVGTGTVEATGAFTVPMGVLALGTRTVTATVVDPAGNRSSDATLTARVDLAAPLPVVTFPGGTTYSANGYRSGCSTTSTYDVCGTAVDSGTAYSSGLSSVQLEIRQGSTCRTSAGTFTTAGCATRLTPTGRTSWAFTTGLLPTGSYTLTVWAADSAGNVAQVSVAFARG